MKCRTCEKEIPETSQVCPFCYTTVVRDETQNKNITPNVDINNTSNLTTINTDTIGASNGNSELNFGDLNNTTYDNSTIQIAEKKSGNKIQLGIIILVSVLAVVAIIVVAIFLLNKPKVYSYQYYTGVVDKVYDYLDENLVSDNASNNGNYKIYYTYQGVTKEFKGEYRFDVEKRLLGITGEEKDPEEEKGGVVIGELPTTKIEFALKNNNLYFNSSDIYDTPILFPYEDDIGLLATKQYDADTLLSGVKEAVNLSLKELDYDVTKKVSLDDNGDDSYEMISLKVDYQTKATFLSKFYETLLKNSNFISEYAKIKNRNEEDIERIFKNYQLTYEHKYSTDDGKVTYVNLYHKGKDVVRIDIINENNKTKTRVNFKKNEIDIIRYEDNHIVKSLVVNKIDNTMNEKLTRNYKIDYVIDNETININIELTKNDNASIKVNELQNAKSIRDFSQDDLNKLKTTTSPYIKDTKWIDELQKIFGTKCTKELTCICNVKTCSCELNDRIIECPIGSVNSSNNPNPTE